jgi:Archaeal fructose-1,6-bisphosphatase and related enzymes of inositol monophosphatase family
MLESIIRIVKEASGLMETDTFEISQKEGYSNIVTSSDLKVQEFLCTRLAELLPGSGFLCEEEDMIDVNHEYSWIIDPIDGTTNYSRGIDQCAICVGLRHNGEMEKAVVYLPFTNELFSAEKGRGAFLGDRRIHVSDRPFEDSILCSALAVYHKDKARVCAEIIHDTFLQCNDIRRFGASAPELCYLALGRCELYFEYLLSPWDFAAASLILTEAGGCICDLSGNPLSCIKPSGVLAANNQENLLRLKTITDRNLGQEGR